LLTELYNKSRVGNWLKQKNRSLEQGLLRQFASLGPKKKAFLSVGRAAARGLCPNWRSTRACDCAEPLKNKKACLKTGFPQKKGGESTEGTRRTYKKNES
jgi:hypothetical protein